MSVDNWWRGWISRAGLRHISQDRNFPVRLVAFMKTPYKRPSKKPNTKTSGPKESRPKQTQVIEQLRRERDEALEQLAAASQILGVIASSPTRLQPVLDVV